MFIKTLKTKTLRLLFIVGFLGSIINSCTPSEINRPVVSSPLLIEDKPSIDVCFSPEGNCQPIILHLINHAKSKILVQSYSFTSKEISNAIIKAHQKGIEVKILFDRSQLTARHSQIHRMKEAGIEALVDPVPGISHNKIMIFDEDIILTGSYNFTNAAETRNAENLLIIKNRPTVKIYKRNWKRRYERAKEINLKSLTKKILPDIIKRKDA